MKKLIVLLGLLLSGCGLYPLDFSKVQTQTQTQVDNTIPEVVAQIKQSTLNMTLADRVVMYKTFKGFVGLLNSAVPKTSVDAFNQLDKVEKIYGWENKKYPLFTAAVKDVLSNPKYNPGKPFKTPQNIEDVRAALVPVIESIAEGLK